MKSQPVKPPGAVVMPEPGLPHGAMAGAMILLQPGPTFPSEAHVTTKVIWMFLLWAVA